MKQLTWKEPTFLLMVVKKSDRILADSLVAIRNAAGSPWPCGPIPIKVINLMSYLQVLCVESMQMTFSPNLSNSSLCSFVIIPRKKSLSKPRIPSPKSLYRMKSNLRLHSLVSWRQTCARSLGRLYPSSLELVLFRSGALFLSWTYSKFECNDRNRYSKEVTVHLLKKIILVSNTFWNRSL